MRTATICVLASIAALAGCQGPDVGQSCELQTADGGVDLNDPNVPVSADFFESGNLGCDNLVCIRSPNPQGATKIKSNPYCSKACVSNSDCFQGDTGLVCRSVTVDFDFVNCLAQQQRDTYYRTLGCQVPEGGTICDPNGQKCANGNCRGVTPTCQFQFSSYCAAPLQ